MSQQPSLSRFRPDMDRGWHLAGCPGHASVGHQSYLETTILKNAKVRGQLVQFRHTDRLRPLIANHSDEVAFQITALERSRQIVLIFKHNRFGLDHTVLWCNSGNLDHTTPQVAFQEFQAAVFTERFRHRAQHGFIQRSPGSISPHQLAIIEERFPGIARQAMPHHRHHVFVQVTTSQQLTHQIRHAACGLKVVDISFAVGINPRQQRHSG